MARQPWLLEAESAEKIRDVRTKGHPGRHEIFRLLTRLQNVQLHLGGAVGFAAIHDRVGGGEDMSGEAD
jgi:hypothetical protein